MSAADVRRQLAALGIPFVDPATGRHPSAVELDDAADELIRRAARVATLRGAAGTFGGLVTTGPEAATALVQTLRLAQRLAVLHGIDPDTDRGRLLLSRALAAAWEIELPREGPWSTNLRQLPELLRARLPDRAARSVTPLARALARRALFNVGRRVGRIVPGFGTAAGAAAARRQITRQGRRMQAVYRRAWEGELGPVGEVVDVVEVDGGGGVDASVLPEPP